MLPHDLLEVARTALQRLTMATGCYRCGQCWACLTLASLPPPSMPPYDRSKGALEALPAKHKSTNLTDGTQGYRRSPLTPLLTEILDNADGLHHVVVTYDITRYPNVEKCSRAAQMRCRKLRHRWPMLEFATRLDREKGVVQIFARRTPPL